MRCCARGETRGRGGAGDGGGADAREHPPGRANDDAVADDDSTDVDDARERGAIDARAWDGSTSTRGSIERGEFGGRRSAWDRAEAGEGADGGEDASPTHSTFGRDSERKRRMRKTSRLLAERLGGGVSASSDDEEFASGYERARAGGDEERGFGFVSKADIAERKRREEERKDEERRAKKEAKKRERRERRERERREAAESETASLLDNGGRSRKRMFFKASVVTKVIVASAAVVACGVGAVMYARGGGHDFPNMMKIRSGETTLTTADPALQPLKSTTDTILKQGTSGESNSTKEDASDEKKVEVNEASSGEKRNTSKKDADADADDDDDDDDDDDESSEKRKKKSKKKFVEASLGVVRLNDDVKVTSACSPIHSESVHGIYRQYNKACMGEGHKPTGCMQSTSEGCQSCFLDGSPASTQSGSYARCSHHVCSAFGVKGCDPDPLAGEKDQTDEGKETEAKEGDDGEEKKPSTRPRTWTTPKKSLSRLAASNENSGHLETCLPNLEDAKRGIFQYPERYCRTMGHTDVDYSGCVSVGKSSCRMCVTRSASGAGAAFSVCPRSVCENHDLLYQQCADESSER